MCSFVKTFEVNFIMSKIDGIHSAAQVNADYIWDGLINNGHCSAYRTAFSCVNVGHDSDFRALCKRIIAHAPDLLNGLVFDYVCVTDCRIDFSLNFNHCPVDSP